MPCLRQTRHIHISVELKSRLLRFQSAVVESRFDTDSLMCAAMSSTVDSNSSATTVRARECVSGVAAAESAVVVVVKLKFA